MVDCAKVPASFLYLSNARRARGSTRGDMNTPGRSFLAEGLKELRAAIGEVRAEIEEVESPPLSPAVRERLNTLLEAEQILHTKIEVLDCRVTPYCDMEIDAEAEDCAEWLAFARQTLTRTREERLSLKTKTDRPDMRAGAQQNTPLPTALNNPEGDTFSASEDYRSVRFKGELYVTTRYQAIMIRVMHEAHIAGHPDVGARKLLEAIENETSDVRNAFKKSPLWRTLVVCKRKGTYRLNLPED
jgi:hypothetical protein